MTVSTNSPRKDYTGTNSTATYPYDFPVSNASDLLVVERDTDGIETTLVLNTDYSVVMLTASSGNVIRTAGNLPTDYHWTILLNLPYTQPTSIRNQGEFYEAVHEQAIDRSVLLVKQLEEKVSRAILLPVTMEGADGVISGLTPGYAIGINATGDGLVSVANSGASQVADLANAANAAKGAGMVAHTDSLTYTAGSVGAFLNKFKDYADALYGAGMSGFAYALSYAANTVGAAIKAVMDRATVLEAKKQIQPITATVAANALTVTLNPCVLEFRDSSLTSGTVNQRTVSVAISVVVPSTATLGTVNAVAARLALVAIDNAGTVELAIVNLAGGNQLDETNLISTTAISTGADSNNVIYSASARTSVPYRVVGFIDITEATAGTWATAPSTIQGQGGQSMSMASPGFGQTWQNVAASRALGTTYYNTTGKQIAVAASMVMSTTANAQITINGSIVIPGGTCGVSVFTGVYAEIPPGASYMVNANTGSPTLDKWAERR